MYIAALAPSDRERNWRSGEAQKRNAYLPVRLDHCLRTQVGVFFLGWTRLVRRAWHLPWWTAPTKIRCGLRMLAGSYAGLKGVFPRQFATIFREGVWC